MLLRKGEDKPPCLVPTHTLIVLLSFPHHFTCTVNLEYQLCITCQQCLGRAAAALWKRILCVIALSAPSASNEQVYTELTRELQYVVTSLNNAVAISVPRPGKKPNCNSWYSWLLLSSKTHF